MHPCSIKAAATPDGTSVPIEERTAEEVIGSHGAEVKVANPAFDVTPAELVSGIITEQGIFAPQELAQRFR